jgi:predicted aminopeptidase
MRVLEENLFLVSVKWRSVAIIFIAFALPQAASAQGLAYYWQSITGHMAVLNAARPVRELLDDPQTPATLKTRLELAQRIRAFASKDLHLPDNASYQRYADIKRSAVVWNVVAAPPDSLTLKTFCFPIAGCAGYKGYYAEAEARAEAERLKAEGLEVSVYGVPAYSTLGYMNWAGGDPLLSTFITYPEGELARMVFHELAHQVAYAKDDTMFNESFATAVERLGGQAWLAQHASQAAREEYAALDARRSEFKVLTLATRRNLEKIYRDVSANRPYAAIKNEAMEKFRKDYATLKESWNGYAGYDAWVARANNASFGALAAYDELVPGFEALFEKEGRDWQRFYAVVKRLAEMPVVERRAILLIR